MLGSRDTLGSRKIRLGREARFPGKISTLTGADVAHPGSRSQGILRAHLCTLRPKTLPLYSGEAKRVTPWPLSPSSTPGEPPVRRTKTSSRGSQTDLHDDLLQQPAKMHCDESASQMRKFH